MKSEMKMPRDRDREVKYQKNSREFSRNETLAGYCNSSPNRDGKIKITTLILKRGAFSCGNFFVPQWRVKPPRLWKSLSAGNSLSQTEKNSLGVCSVTVVCTAQCWDCAVYTLLRLCGVYTAETLCTMYSETPTVWGKVRVLWIDTSNNLNYWSKFDQNLINSWSSNTFSRKIEATHFI